MSARQVALGGPGSTGSTRLPRAFPGGERGPSVRWVPAEDACDHTPPFSLPELTAGALTWPQPPEKAFRKGPGVWGETLGCSTEPRALFREERPEERDNDINCSQLASFTKI